MNMASLMAWIRAGLRSGPRLLFLTLLFGLGAVSMGEFATPARAFIRDTFKSDAPEVSKARASLRELHDLSRTLEGELTTATGQVCEAISSHTRSAEIVKYLEATRAKDSTPEKLEKWDRLIASWKAQMLPSSADQDKLGLVLEALYDVDQSVKRLKAVQGAMK
jgi:hypothetical protein